MCQDSLENYLNDLASKKPAPGGGSAAALVGATGAALLSKVANFTVGKEKYKNVEKEITNILKQTEALRENFSKLCVEDTAAYKKLRDVFKLPKGERRAQKIQDALKEAIAVPLEVCKKTLEGIKLCLPLAEKGNFNLITDTFIAGITLNAAFHSAVLNVEINLKSITDREFTRKIKEALEPAEKEIDIISKEIQTRINKYVHQGV